MLLRNDDVAADTTLHEIKRFCELADRYNVSLLHSLTPIGHVRPVHVSMDNATIRRVSGTALFSENTEVVEYLRGRKDKFAVHGLWHTHEPSYWEIIAAEKLIEGLNLQLMADLYYVPPFNEGKQEDCSRQFTFCGSGLPRIEDYLESGDPQAEIMYTHSWRYHDGTTNQPGRPFTWEQLDKCLKRLTAR